MTAAHEPDPILRVTVDTPIYTNDNQKIGKVKELRANAIKVGTPLLQRDYWLMASAVASATPDAIVILAFDRAHLDEHKLSQPA